ncbi:MAG: hypothetical protein PHU71_06270 [Candidatus Gracilibacteria bacterium]|nr:hypothetical protein [Candidatus Gracilibacteria bacterium]
MKNNLESVARKTLGVLSTDFLALTVDRLKTPSPPRIAPSPLHSRSMAGLGDEHCISNDNRTCRIFTSPAQFQIVREDLLPGLEWQRREIMKKLGISFTREQSEAVSPVPVQSDMDTGKLGTLYPRALESREMGGSINPDHCISRDKTILSVFAEPASHYHVIAPMLERMEEVRGKVTDGIYH